MRDNATILNILTFKKLGSNRYEAKANIDDEFVTYIEDIMDGFTLCQKNIFSPAINLETLNEITSRVVADAFYYTHEKIVKENELGIEIVMIVNDSSRVIKLAYNEMLGGLVYGMEY